MADSRNKGAAFERDLVKRLNTFFADNGVVDGNGQDLTCKRNLDQYQTAACVTLRYLVMLLRQRRIRAAGGMPLPGGTRCARRAALELPSLSISLTTKP